MKYKAVIFDLDGTLVHTQPEYRYKIVRQALHDLGKDSSNHYIDRFWYESRRDDIIKEHFELEPIVFWKKYNVYDTVELRKQLTRLYADVDFIKELKAKGFKVGIVTGAPLHIASLEIGMIGQDVFDVVIIATTSNGYKPKPHPYSLQECLNLLGVTKDEAIYVGNADEDVLTARNAEVFDVLLVRGEHDFPDITPSLKIHSLYELRKFLGI